jgi:membrane-bound lytic murein transglycosylase D
MEERVPLMPASALAHLTAHALPQDPSRDRSSGSRHAPAHACAAAWLAAVALALLSGCATLGPAAPAAAPSVPAAPSKASDAPPSGLPDPSARPAAPAAAVPAEAVAGPTAPSAATDSAAPTASPAATAAPATAAPATAAPATAAPATAAPATAEPPATLDDLLASLTSQHGDLWERVRKGLAVPDLEGPLVQRREQYYSSQPEYLRRMTERAGRYLFYIVEEVDRRGLPMELALLPFIESAFNPQALSSAKASGIWQFMPATGRHFDLTQNLFRDDRRDVIASTHAALDYLQKLHGMFGDWHLALAAYNWGEGNVQRAIARNRAAGLPTGYENLRMPRETRDYVPKLQAIENLVARPSAYGVTLEPLADHPYFTTVPIRRDIDVALAARLAGLELDDFKALNPQMNKPVILAAGTPTVLLPHDNAEQFVIALSQHDGPLASWTAWVAPSTMAPAAAARQVGMSEAQLREVNRIPAGVLVRGGSALLVPRAPTREADVSEHLADNGMLELAPDPASRRRTVLKAGRNDSVASVARRYRVGVAQVAEWNNVRPDARFRPGEAIVVFTHPRSVQRAVAASARTSARRPAASARSGRAAASPPRAAARAPQPARRTAASAQR